MRRRTEDSQEGDTTEIIFELKDVTAADVAKVETARTFNAEQATNTIVLQLKDEVTGKSPLVELFEKQSAALDPGSLDLYAAFSWTATAVPSASPSASPSGSPSASPTLDPSASPTVPLADDGGAVSAAAGAVATALCLTIALLGTLGYIARATIASAARRTAAKARRLLRAADPAIALFVTFLQTAAAMGEVRCVRETVPVLRDLAGWLSWAMLDLPVPGGMRVNATASGETEETVDAQNGFIAAGFWMCALSLLAVIAHVPVWFAARSRVRHELRLDKDAFGAGAAGEFADLKGEDLDADETLPQDRPPTLADKGMNSFPKVELFLVLLGYQGISEGSSAVLFRSAASVRGTALRVVAGLVFLLVPVGFWVFVAWFVWKHTRGPGARSVCISQARRTKGTDDCFEHGFLCFCKKKDHTGERRKAAQRRRWVDKQPRSMGSNIGAFRPLADARGYRYREDEHGRFWSGFTERWGVLWCFFAPSKAWGGAPAGLLVLLLHRCLIGVVIGALDGADIETQRTQTTAMLVLFALAAVYIACAKPFLLRQANFGEGLARHASAEDFCRLKAPCCTAMDWIFIPAYCFAIP